MTDTKLSMFGSVDNERVIIDISESGVNVIGSITKTLISNPLLGIGAFMLATDAYQKMTNNNKNLVRVTASPANEREYKKMVDQMIKTTKWKLIKDEWGRGVRTWVLRRSSLTEAHGDESNTRIINLKKNKVSLTPGEKQEAISAGCVVETGPYGNPECGIWVSKENNNRVFVCEVGNSFQVKRSLGGAIRAFHSLKG